MDYNLIIDIESRRLIADYYSTEAGAPPTIVFGDQPTVNVRLVEPNNNDADIPFKDVASLTGQAIRVAVGSLENATPSAYIELTDDLSAASATITEVRAGVLNTTNELQRVQILDAVAGSYTLTIAGETTNPISLDASLENIACELEDLASITADSIWVTGDNADFTVEFDSSLADVGPITVNLDNVTNRVGKTGTLNLHTEEILTLLNSLTTVEATLEVVRWTTADVAGETVLQVPVTVMQDVIPDTVPDSTPLPGYATIDLDHINQSGAATGQIPTWNGSEWVPSTVAGTGDLLSTANLSDLADIPTARTNLGLGTAATTDATDYATTAQGTLADSASQPGHTHVASTDIVATGTPSATTYLRGDDTWATVAGGGGDMVSTNNLSDVASASTSRTNLGLGTAATSNTGDFASASHTHPSSDISDATADGIALITSSDANPFTDAQQTLLGNQSGTNTGDQDLSAYQLEPSEGAFVNGDKTKLDGIEASADVTDEANVVSSLSGATITDAGTPASDDKVLIQDTSDSNNLKYVDISDLPSGGGGGASVSVSDTAPSSPSAGDLWFDSSTAKMYVYYNDGNSNQWVSVTSGLPTPDSKTGWMDYNDSTGSFTVAADTWTNVPNNGAGSFTNKTFKPPSVTEVLDTTTGHLDFSDLPLGSEISLRNDITVVPNSNNALLQMRYVLGTGANEYALNFLNDRLDSGSGVTYQKVSTFPIYMGDTNTKNNAGKLQIKLSVAGTVTNSGVYASIQLY
jgi:hypothetical protein